MTIESKIARLEKKIIHLQTACTKINDKYMGIIHTRNHYLRHRAPGVNKRQKLLLRAALTLEKKFRTLKKVGLHMTHSTRSGKQNILLLVTANQARKLRAIADSNLTHFLNSKDNIARKNPVILNYSRSRK